MPTMRATLWRPLALAVLLTAAGPARADRIDWSYSSFLFPNAMRPEAPVTTQPAPGPILPGPIYPYPPYPIGASLTFSATAGEVVGNSNVLLGNIYATSYATYESPDKFKDLPLHLIVGIDDKASNKTALATFTGKVSGSL